MKNIFLALDFEEKAQKLIDFATELAKKFNAKVWVVHIAAPDPEFVGYEIGPKYIRDTRAEELRTEHRFLQNIATELGHVGVKSEGLLIQGPTVEMILEEAMKLKADLIITGSHEHSFLHSAMYGNTARELVKRSRIPLMIIPVDE